MTWHRYPCQVGADDVLSVDTDHATTGVGMQIDEDGEACAVVLGRDDVAELHRQLGRWLGANPTGLTDVCPGSSQPPATHVPRARQGTCAACGDRFMVTSRGLVYKHRRRP